MSYKAPLSSDYQFWSIDNYVERNKGKSLLYTLGKTGCRI